MFVDNIENCSGNLESSSMPAQVGDTFCNLWSRGVLHHKFNRLNMSQSKMVIQKEVHTQYSLCLEIRAAFNATAARPKPSRATKLCNLRANGFETQWDSIKFLIIWSECCQFCSESGITWRDSSKETSLLYQRGSWDIYIEFSILGKFKPVTYMKC